MPAGRTNLRERYELGEVLGHGGMGVVYRATDRLMQREVALKTLLDIDNPQRLEQFYKECSILAAMVHPNIINVYDIGEFEEHGVTKPFFVMPLLPGATLDRIIRNPASRLTVELVIEIVTQACRGLQAAHDMGLVHRDVKPSNLFVMEDYSVKIIDFGIARAAAMGSVTGLKGTLSYMAPEQLSHRPPTPLSDQYSLAVVCYEALVGRRPFHGATVTELAEAILHQVPPAISDLNPNVRYTVSQVIRKAMAKQPAQRFANMRELSDALARANRGEAPDPTDADKIKPRLERANAAFEHGDFEFASELLSELENDGYLDENITLLRRRLQQSISRTRVRQLLDNANRSLRAQEYQLALRKVQEALALDPEHPDALLLQSRVEKERVEKKVEEWLELARVQVEQQAFYMARVSLASALRIKPNEPEALRLLAEVSRREQELAKTRVQKAALYDAAAQAWERGEMASALCRLDELLVIERDHPDTGAGRVAVYQGFSQQVRAEHDALQQSYAEARQRMEAHDIENVLALCGRCLARYPDHALFQALQLEAEAVAHPGRSAKLLEEKRTLVQSVAGKARFYEQRQLLAEALDQWQIMKTIEPGYPGLDGQIERMAALRERQARQAAKERAIEAIGGAIQAGDYDRALRAVQGALSEFPDDPEFSARVAQVNECRERTAQAFVMIDQAREHAGANRPQDSLRLLRQAQALDGGNPVVRTIVLNMLLEQARGLIQHADPDAAEQVLRDVLQIEPDHVEAHGLASQIADGKRQEFVAWCVDQAGRMQAQGDVPGALVLVRRGLVTYPQDPTLQRLESALAGTAYAGEAPPLDHPAAPPAPADDPSTTRTQSGMKLPQPSPPLFFEPALPPARAPRPGAPVLEDGTATLFKSPVSARGKQEENLQNVPPGVEGAQTPDAPPAAVPAVPPLVPVPPAPPRAKRKWMAAAVGALMVLLLLLAAVLFIIHRRAVRQTSSALAHVRLQASPAQASLLIDGRACGSGACAIDLPPGRHLAEAILDGYTPATTSFEIRAGVPAPPPLQLMLTPRLPAAILSTNLNQATVSLDQGAAQPVQNGEIQLTNLAAGQRTIKFTGEGAEGVLTVTIAPAEAPRLDLPIRQQNLGATIVSSLGGSAKIVTTLQKAEALVDGRPAGKIETAGVDLTNLAPGVHELVVKAQGVSHRLSFNAGPAPAMAVFFGAERNQGVLRVITGENDVAVYINGVKTRRVTKDGRLVLYLEPNTYRIRVEKAGFQPVTEQSVEIKRGEEARADFPMARLPQSGSLLVQKAPVGAEVALDGTPVGTVRADGTFPLGDLKPGNHTLAIRKDSYRPLTRQISVVAGQQLDVDGTLQLLAGTVNVSIAPTDVAATLSWQREGEENIQAFTDNPLTLPEGSYTIIGRAPGYEEARAPAKITAGHAAAAVLIFRRIAAARIEPVRQNVSLADLEKTGGWTREDGVLTRTGGNNILLRIAPGAGTYSFRARMPKGKRLEWLVNYVDPKNYVIYELNEDRLERAEYIDGKKLNTAKPRLRVKLDQWIQVTVEVTDTGIVNSVQQESNRYPAIDRLSPDGPKLAAVQSFLRGRFGFRVPTKDRLAIETFTFTPK